MREEGWPFSCGHSCTRDAYGKAGPFSVERLKMDPGLLRILCVYKQYRTVPALLLRASKCVGHRSAKQALSNPHWREGGQRAGRRVWRGAGPQRGSNMDVWVHGSVGVSGGACWRWSAWGESIPPPAARWRFTAGAPPATGSCARLPSLMLRPQARH